MIPNDQPLRQEVINRMIRAIIDDRENVEYSDWEINFMTSIEAQFDKKKDLSDKQCEILERIYDK